MVPPKLRWKRHPLCALRLTRGVRFRLALPSLTSRLTFSDSHFGLCPIGVIGELYIGGVGVGRGYHHRPELTAERFLPDPFSSQPGARIYKTGDLVRYLPDQNIEFLGRNDYQVKICGFRVELGEIEAALARHPAVSQAVMLARQTAALMRRPANYQVPNERHQETTSENSVTP